MAASASVRGSGGRGVRGLLVGAVRVDADPTSPAVPTVWFLTGEEVAATRAKLANLQARAIKKGFTGHLELVATPATRSYSSAGGLPVTVHGFDVTVTGEPPRYQGWRFVAAVDSVDGKAVLRYPPGTAPTVANDRVRPGECDHCHTTRLRRSTVLVAHDDTGRLLQVGRSCLKDFLGHSSLPVFLTDDDVTAHLRPTGAGSAVAGWDTDTVLAYAWAAVTAFGWTPTSAADSRRPPTRDLVRDALGHDAHTQDLRAVLAPHLAEAVGQAPVIRAALLAGLTATSGYEANLTAVLRCDQVEARHLGLAVSAIAAHQRLHIQQERAAAVEQARTVVDHAGVVGERVTLTGTVTTALRVDGYTYHSPDQVLLIIDAGTAVAKTTTTAAWAYHVKVGDQITVTGTVKAHTEWRGLKQTVLTRPKPTDDPNPPTQPTLTDDGLHRAQQLSHEPAHQPHSRTRPVPR